MLVFQYPIVSIMEVVIQWATLADGKYCAFSWAPKYGAFWVSILRSFTTTMAIIAVVRFYTNMKHTMTTRRPLAKLVCFKLIIFVTSTVQVSKRLMPICSDRMTADRNDSSSCPSSSTRHTLILPARSATAICDSAFQPSSAPSWSSQSQWPCSGATRPATTAAPA